MLDETDIQKLLRLKRYEQPPAGYHEKFLHDFHRRQRAEVLRQPFWKLGLERLGAFFSDHSMGRLAYGAASAVVLLFAGVASYEMVASSNVSNPATPQIASANTGSAAVPVDASNSSQQLPAIAEHDPVIADQQPEQQLPMHGPVDVSLAPTTSLPALNTQPASDTHYIIGTRPASYERPFSF